MSALFQTLQLRDTTIPNRDPDAADVPVLRSTAGPLAGVPGDWHSRTTAHAPWAAPA